MPKSPIVQVGFLMPVFAELMEAGVNVEHLLKLSGLHKFKLNDPNLYVPGEFMHDFFTRAQHQQGIDDLAAFCGKKIELVSVSQWGELVVSFPDLLSAFQFCVDNRAVVFSHQTMALDINGAVTTYRQCLAGASSLGRDQTDYLAFSLMIKTVQLALGSNWTPLEIHFQSNTMPNLDGLFPSGCDAKIFLGQPATAIKFPTSLLTKPMSTANSTANLEIGFPALGSISSRINRMLDAKHDELPMNINLIAEMTSMTTRTLQRHLAEEDTSVSAVIDKWSFKKSLKLLEIGNLNIKEISEILGYSEVSNFNRAFRRWTSTTPSGYREKL